MKHKHEMVIFNENSIKRNISMLKDFSLKKQIHIH